MLANPLELRGRHRVNNMNPEAALEAEGWGNNMIEAYTGNHAGHRVSRKHLKVDIVVRDGNTDHTAKDQAGMQRGQSTHVTRGTNILDPGVSRTLSALGTKAAKDPKHRSSLRPRPVDQEGGGQGTQGKCHLPALCG